MPSASRFCRMPSLPRRTHLWRLRALPLRDHNSMVGGSNQPAATVLSFVGRARAPALFVGGVLPLEDVAFEVSRMRKAGPTLAKGARMGHPPGAPGSIRPFFNGRKHPRSTPKTQVPKNLGNWATRPIFACSEKADQLSVRSEQSRAQVRSGLRHRANVIRAVLKMFFFSQSRR